MGKKKKNPNIYGPVQWMQEKKNYIGTKHSQTKEY
jgi:hypothetical protein